MLSDFYSDIIVLTLSYCTMNICLTLLTANKVSCTICLLARKRFAYENYHFVGGIFISFTSGIFVESTAHHNGLDL